MPLCPLLCTTGPPCTPHLNPCSIHDLVAQPARLLGPPHAVQLCSSLHLQHSTLCAAAFVTCSAAGMALGPLLALPLQHFPDLHYLGLSFNPVTMGAWVMSAIWVVFLTITLICFSEPPVR